MNHTEPRGQILPGSRFGDLLTELAKEAEVICEIGTWHGLGSTKCLANGLVRHTQRMWTFERDKEVSAEAASYYNDSRITFVNGSILETPRTHTFRNIDLLLLDGDDIETEQEFQAYKDSCKVIALDDTNERKNRLQRAIILNNPQTWQVIEDCLSGRLGWLIASRK